jgi:hypothetical protein
MCLSIPFGRYKLIIEPNGCGWKPKSTAGVHVQLKLRAIFEYIVRGNSFASMSSQIRKKKG